MTNLLTITSSINAANSNTNALIQDFVENWTMQTPDATVTHRDLGAEPLPHLDGVTVGAFYTPAEQRDEQAQQALALSDTLVAELEAADVIVLGAPMYNFAIPSGLKAWIDHIARVGRTFQYTEQGPQGLLTGKQVFVFGARGGDYSEDGPMAAMDFITPYLRTVLGFVGLTDVTFIHAEGVAAGTEGLENAHKMIKSTLNREAA